MALSPVSVLVMKQKGLQDAKSLPSDKGKFLRGFGARTEPRRPGRPWK
jgi:hypothetical protein